MFKLQAHTGLNHLFGIVSFVLIKARYGKRIKNNCKEIYWPILTKVEIISVSLYVIIESLLLYLCISDIQVVKSIVVDLISVTID